jgi:uncharacterized membrane protein SirB2
MDELTKELELQLEKQERQSKKARKFQVIYTICIVLLLATLVCAIGYVIYIPENAQSGFLLTKLALVVAISSVGIAYFQYAGVGDSAKQKNETKLLNLLTLNTAVAIANSQAHSQEEKMKLLRDLNEINLK